MLWTEITARGLLEKCSFIEKLERQRNAALRPCFLCKRAAQILLNSDSDFPLLLKGPLHMLGDFAGVTPIFFSQKTLIKCTRYSEWCGPWTCIRFYGKSPGGDAILRFFMRGGYCTPGECALLKKFIAIRLRPQGLCFSGHLIWTFFWRRLSMWYQFPVVGCSKDIFLNDLSTIVGRPCLWSWRLKGEDPRGRSASSPVGL